ncbi:MAG TPA: D-alanyl-D-alanine carboxypeptidase family protein [Bacillota bacterium]|nr:D-alanyl-D-alanine carboxypeptidase family protein [Bacillota bacterium]
MSTFTLIKRDGTTEERPFQIISGREMISPHIARAEFGEHDEAGRLRTGVPIRALEPLVELFEAVRAAVGQPIPIHSGYRSVAKQQELYQRDIREHGGKPSGEVARPDCAPHTYGAAMDLGLPRGLNAARFAAIIRQTSVKLGLPQPRTGWRMYGGRFVHMDMVFLCFEPYTNKPNPAPRSWRSGVSW